jgi:16S rRNA (cytosine967-C5)-methyltransferase
MTPGTPSIPLWRQLHSVASVLAAVRAGQSATQAVANVDAALRPGVQALVFQVLRQSGRAEHLRQQLAHRAPPPEADALLCTALALAWDPAQAPYEPFTLVNQAVEAAKRHPDTRAQAAFVNACLRRFLRERDALVAAGQQDPVAVWNHPRWWIDRLRQDHPKAWRQVLEANNRHPPMTLRVNRSKTTQVLYQSSLLAINIIAKLVGEDGLELAHACPVSALPGFSDGLVSVQDAAAQCAAPLLLTGLVPIDRKPLRLLDACAAPGGKTAHLLEWAVAAGQPVDLTALDVDVARCERIHDTLHRLGLQARVIAADAAEPAKGWYAAAGGALFDAILLDAPCTASGIVRRHPDIRWLRRESDIAQLAAVQARLLQTLWPLVRDGGRLLYCTCSVFKAEGYEQIQTFVAHNKDALLLPSPGHLMPQSGAKDEAVRDNLLGDHDGFFYALLEKRPA